MKEWVARVQELNRYLKDFLAHNANSTQFGVPASWHREFTIQGFDPVDQGLCTFVEFCTSLESCEPSKDEPK
eukprot:1348065-Ditylum_brightwellii.AAC.1